MHTLKVQLGLTLSVLLLLSMFLFGLVLLMFWQRSAIKQETHASERLLHLASVYLQADINAQNGQPIPPEFVNFFKQNEIACLQWQQKDSTTPHSFGFCPSELSLDSLLRDVTQNGKTQTAYSGVTWNGFFFTGEYLLLATPFQSGQESQGAIGLVRSLQDVSISIYNIQKIFFGYLAVNVLIFATIGFTRLVHLVIRPIQRLARLADSRSDQTDSSFFPGEGLGEFTQLSLSLNRLLTRIDGDKQELQATVGSLKKANRELQRNRKEMLRTEKLASVGRLSAGLAHEIGNPLAIIQGYIELLAGDTLSQDDRALFSKKAVQELSRINTLIRNLLDLSRAPTTSAIHSVEIHTLLRELIKTVCIKKTTIAINFETDFPAIHTEVTVDSDGLRQVFLNCILNSIDAIEENKAVNEGKIILSTNNETTDDGKEYILITLRDNGTGISEEHLETIFDPFFTTKEPGKGTGLGLTVAHNLIEKSGGQLNVCSTEGQGTTLTVKLPISSQPIT
jgi:two-component system, NtrC family, sensor kinase